MTPHCHPAVLHHSAEAIKHQEQDFSWINVLWRVRPLLFPLNGGLSSQHAPLGAGSFTEKGPLVFTSACRPFLPLPYPSIPTPLQTRLPFSTAFAFVIHTPMSHRKFSFPALGALCPPALCWRMPCHCHLHPFLALILSSDLLQVHSHQ